MGAIGNLPVGLEPAALIRNYRMIGGGENFLLNRFFNNSVVHQTQAILLSESVGYVRIIPVVGRDEPAVPRQHTAGTVKSIVPPKLRTSLALTESIAMEPMIGGATYQGMNTDLNAALVERIKKEQIKEKASFNLTKEKWIADLLVDGQVTLTDINGTSRFTLDFGYVTTGTAAARNVKTALTGTNAWHSSESNPADDLLQWEREIRAYSSYQGKLIVLVGYDVAAVLKRHPKITDALDNRRIMIGNLQAEDQNHYIGSLETFDLFKYHQSGWSATGTTPSDLFDARTVIMMPADPMAFGMHYGAVYERRTSAPDARMEWIPTDWYSKLYSSEDPAQNTLITESRPVPVIEDVRAIRVCKVIPDTADI